MSHPRKTYRIYCFDSAHKILTVDLIEAVDDEDAIAEAEAMAFCSKYEIWDGERLVAHGQSERQSG